MSYPFTPLLVEINITSLGGGGVIFLTMVSMVNPAELRSPPMSRIAAKGDMCAAKPYSDTNKLDHHRLKRKVVKS